MRLVICLLLLMLVTPAGAQTPDARAVAEAHAKAAKDWQAKAAETEKEVAILEKKAHDLEIKRIAAQRKGARLHRELTRLEARETQVTHHLTAERRTLMRLLAALMRLGREPVPALVASPHNALEAARAARLMASITPELKIRANLLRAELETLKAIRANITGVRSTLRDTRVEAETFDSNMTHLLDEKRRLVAIYQARAAREVEALTEMVAADGTLSALLTQLRPTSEPVKPNRHGKLPLPAPFTRLDAVGGAEPHFKLTLPPGTQIKAPVVATVSYIGPLKGYGGVIILDLGGGDRLILTGIARAFREGGEVVSAGDVLAESAADTPSVLRLEARHNQAIVNPKRWFLMSPQQNVTIP